LHHRARCGEVGLACQLSILSELHLQVQADACLVLDGQLSILSELHQGRRDACGAVEPDCLSILSELHPRQPRHTSSRAS